MNPCGGTVHRGGEKRKSCDLWHLSGEGVHRRPKGVNALPFCAAAGVKGVVKGLSAMSSRRAAMAEEK
jgi:hypothetical protein